MKMKSLIGAALFLTCSHALAGVISGGDFSDTCSLSGWDEYGDTSINGAPGSCHADLAVNDVDWEAELSQMVSFDATTNYVLSVDFDFSSTLGSALDEFFISLINMDWEFYDLLEPTNISLGNNTLDIMISGAYLDSNFTNQDWKLALYLADYNDSDQSSALVSINSMSINEQVSDVPEPGSLGLMSLALIGLLSKRQFKKGADRI